MANKPYLNILSNLGTHYLGYVALPDSQKYDLQIKENNWRHNFALLFDHSV